MQAVAVTTGIVELLDEHGMLAEDGAWRLRLLQLERLDLLQFHAWNYADARWLDDLFWLQELQEEGLIRHLGPKAGAGASMRTTAKSCRATSRRLTCRRPDAASM